MGLSELMKKWHRRYVEDEDEQAHISHSISYHSFFQGYSEEKVLRDGGNGYRIVREYTAPYLAFTEDKRIWLRFKILYSALYLASAGLCLLALCSGARANGAGWVAVFGVLQMLALLLMLIPLGNYIAAPMYMQMGQYNISAKRIGCFSKPASALAALYWAAGLGWYAVNGALPGKTDVVCLLLQLISAAAILALCVLEHRMKYAHIANPKASPKEDGRSQIW